MAISNDKIMTAKQVPMELVLNKLGHAVNSKGYCCCPFHDEKTPSAKVTDRNLLVCFGKCSPGENGSKPTSNFRATWNTIDIVMAIKSIDFLDALAYLLELDVQYPKQTIKQVERQPTRTAEENYMDTSKVFRPYNSRLRPSVKEPLERHLKERKLHNAIKNLEANGYSIGFTPYGKDKQITYKLNELYIKRGLDGKKYIMGNVKITPLKVNTSNVYVIVEGITDALAVAEMGYNSLSLNGVGNIGLLTNLILEHKRLKEYHYITGTDNDKAGLKGRDELITFFTQHNISWSDFQELRDNPQVKDVGELLIKTNR